MERSRDKVKGILSDTLELFKLTVIRPIQYNNFLDRY